MRAYIIHLNKGSMSVLCGTRRAVVGVNRNELEHVNCEKCLAILNGVEL